MHGLETVQCTASVVSKHHKPHLREHHDAPPPAFPPEQSQLQSRALLLSWLSAPPCSAPLPPPVHREAPSAHYWSQMERMGCRQQLKAQITYMLSNQAQSEWELLEQADTWSHNTVTPACALADHSSGELVEAVSDIFTSPFWLGI